MDRKKPTHINVLKVIKKKMCKKYMRKLCKDYNK